MNKNIIILILCFSFCIFGCGSSDVKKAKEFITAGMYQQAVNPLRNRIDEKPTDAEAHFLLGTCFVYLGKKRMADERFDSAIRIKADYKSNVATEYKKAGYGHLQEGKIDRSVELFNKAINYEPSMKKDIALEYEKYGKEMLDKYEYGKAKLMFDKMIYFSSDLSGNLSGLLIGMLQNGQDNKLYSSEFLDFVMEYNEDKKDILYNTFHEKSRVGNDDIKSLFLIYAMKCSSKKNVAEIKRELAEFYYVKALGCDGVEKANFLVKTKKYTNEHDDYIRQNFLQLLDSLDEDTRATYIDNVEDVFTKKEIFESSVKYFTKKRGTPRKISVGGDKWVEITNKYQEYDVICWLSLYSIYIVDYKKERAPYKWLPRYKWLTNKKYRNKTSKGCYCMWAFRGKKTMYVKAAEDIQTTVYIWITKNK